LAPDLQSGEVLAIAIPHEAARLAPGRPLALGARLQASRTLLQRFQIRLEALDGFAPRKRGALRLGELHLELLGLAQDARRKPFGALGVRLRALERVADEREILVALEHFILEQV